jgi:hypothetical protein
LALNNTDLAAAVTGVDSTESHREKKCATHKEIIDVCQLGLTKIDQNDLLRYFGEKSHDPSLDEKKK